MRRRAKQSAPRATTNGLPRGLCANFRLWMYARGRAGSFGEGKCRLLQSIDAQGSLLSAAKATGMSYRKAWADLRDAEKCLGTKLLMRRRGGRSGGASTLTDDARAVLSAYVKLRGEVAESVQTSFSRFVARSQKSMATGRGKTARQEEAD